MDAVAAAVAVAREHGVRVGEAVVVSDRTNLLVHLRPAPIVARVAKTFTALRGREWARGVVGVQRFLAEAGAPVAAPAEELPPGPHERDGFLITFWRWYDHDGDRNLALGEVGRTLRAVHDAFGRYDGTLPHYTRERELGALLDRLERAGEDVDVLRRGLEEVLARPLAGVPVHGDAHPGNVLRTSAGPLWSDFETACLAPREYDLASVLWSDISLPERPPVAPAVLAGYGEHDPAVLELMLPAYGVFNAAWTVELVRTYRAPRAVEIRDRRVGWWKARYAGG